MSELTNPLFEDEKEFLERKKLEYERALRGDVEHIKENTLQVGKVALAGAGVVGGIWLLSKAFGRRKRHEWHHAEDDNEQYANDFSGFGDDDYQEPAHNQKWGAPSVDDDEPTYFADDENTNYFGDTDLDDNGLSEFPEFEPHSSAQHGSDYYDTTADVYHTDAPEADAAPEPDENRRFWSPEHSHPSANLPYDDSRRLPKSDSFTASTSAPEAAAPIAAQPATAPKADFTPPKSAKSIVGPAIITFLQSETGRVLMAQAATVALALVSKVVKDLLPSDEDKAAKNADLATPTAAAAGTAYGQATAKATQQSPVSDAHDPDTDPAATYQPLA